MLHLSALLSASALLAGNPATRPPARSHSVMMPKFLKELLPNLQKPEDAMATLTSTFAGLVPTAAPPPPPIEVRPPSAAITAAGKGMPLLAPVFSIEADLQALITNFGSYDEEAIRDEIAATKSSAPVVLYTYGLSPFSAEALAVMESTGAKFENVQLGAEWFALGGKGSATRVELRKLYGQGSLPHIFIGGEWVGGLTTGANGGLAGLVERDELVPLLRKAKAV